MLASEEPASADRVLTMVHVRALRLAVRCILSAALAASAGGCAPSAAQTSPVEEPALTVVPPTPSPAPPMQVTELQVLPLLGGSGQQVVGFLFNPSDKAFADTQVQVTLLGASGAMLDSQGVSALLPHLHPHASVPFVATFASQQEAEEARATVVSYQTVNLRPASLEARVQEPFETADGEMGLLGVLRNKGSDDALVSGLAFVARNGQGDLLGVGRRPVFLSLVRANSEEPFLTLFEGELPHANFVPYLDALVVDREPASPVSILTAPSLGLSPRGEPLVLGFLRNDDSSARWARAVVQLSSSGQTVSLAAIDSPVPIMPGGRLPFAVTDFPNVRLPQLGGQWDPESISVIAEVDHARSESFRGELVDVELKVETYEDFGHSLLIRGSVTNRLSKAVAPVAIMGSALTTGGDLVGAGWVGPTEGLEPGETRPFELYVRLSGSLRSTELELDVHAVGVIP